MQVSIYLSEAGKKRITEQAARLNVAVGKFFEAITHDLGDEAAAGMVRAYSTSEEATKPAALKKDLIAAINAMGNEDLARLQSKLKESNAS